MLTFSEPMHDPGFKYLPNISWRLAGEAATCRLSGQSDKE